MSNFELRELQGVAFRDNKKASEKAPDWRGECLVNGQPHELAMWERVGRTGSTFYSFKIGPKREQRRDDDKPRPSQAPRHPNDLDDEVPF